MRAIKQIIKKTSFYKPLRRFYRRLRRVPNHPLQNIPTKRGENIVRLGSEACGWSFVDSGDLHGCIIVSAGLGEDGSFDVEFAQKYEAKVILVDPTPRAIEHFNEICLNFGKPKSQNYISDEGKQPVEAYDLSDLSSENLTLIKKALWNESTELKFYQPVDPRHVSHSISNYQHGYKNDTPFVNVQAITMRELLAELGVEPREIALIKLDIEGAEIEVLTHCMSYGIRPKQILVEFDELNVPSTRGYQRVDQVHQLLCQNGYQMIRTDGQADFLYLREH